MSMSLPDRRRHGHGPYGLILNPAPVSVVGALQLRVKPRNLLWAPEDPGSPQPELQHLHHVNIKLQELVGHRDHPLLLALYAKSA